MQFYQTRCHWTTSDEGLGRGEQLSPALCRGHTPFRTSSYGLAVSVLEISDREARSTVSRPVEDEVQEASVSEVASAAHIPAGQFKPHLSNLFVHHDAEPPPSIQART